MTRTIQFKFKSDLWQDFHGTFTGGIKTITDLRGKVISHEYEVQFGKKDDKTTVWLPEENFRKVDMVKSPTAIKEILGQHL